MKRRWEDKAKKTSLLIPESYIESLDELVEQGYFSNRREAIRLAIRDFLKDNLKVKLIEFAKSN